MSLATDIRDALDAAMDDLIAGYTGDLQTQIKAGLFTAIGTALAGFVSRSYEWVHEGIAAVAEGETFRVTIPGGAGSTEEPLGDVIVSEVYPGGIAFQPDIITCDGSRVYMAEYGSRQEVNAYSPDDLASGNHVWSTNPVSHWVTAIFASGRYVYTGHESSSGHEKITALDADTGSVEYHCHGSYTGPITRVVSNGWHVAWMRDDNVVEIRDWDLSDGSSRTYDHGTDILDVCMDHDQIYVVGKKSAAGHKVVCLDLDGTVLWGTDFFNNSMSHPYRCICDGERVYVSYLSGVFALWREDGTSIDSNNVIWSWSESLGGDLYPYSLAVDSRYLYSMSGETPERFLFIWTRETGQLVRKTNIHIYSKGESDWGILHSAICSDGFRLYFCGIDNNDPNDFVAGYIGRGVRSMEFLTTDIDDMGRKPFYNRALPVDEQ